MSLIITGMCASPYKNIPALRQDRCRGGHRGIRCRAYELHEERGREDGQDVEDWLEAEAEITGRTERAAA